ncbi:acetyltransferase, GNAT family [Marvinbryantia formatexigens DSM 14469]|uniref:Acetyltransferase, GNAT family n=1 Tax=Marvinbryantia formatexigens DSM 14469 TaxID=478749 RepID=C6LEE1_9FIRM|nr:GNAT family N-acetyltransferase [Marvinbryantia formatexigens]EET60924.1 acetyltransferase, GNAT family [Marvinbryantia formatexigens DSM 14469]UWO24779.1 GNAT family N-acetyltransferase [Marvinbryantia formatexigens DSM 14469]SDF23012.1 Acetyltransferase (GNAT) family protein [Marvinbryantia formatexigens]
MRRLKTEQFSETYTVREIREADIGAVCDFCRTNPLYYEVIGEQCAAPEDIRRDMQALPQGKEKKDKYYTGFFEDGHLIAMLDLIDGYPDEKTAFIGFFMVDGTEAGCGIGTRIIDGLCDYLGRAGFEKVRLAYNRDNPQAKHFWVKNAFRAIKETDHPYGRMIVAERSLQAPEESRSVERGAEG